MHDEPLEQALKYVLQVIFNQLKTIVVNIENNVLNCLDCCSLFDNNYALLYIRKIKINCMY